VGAARISCRQHRITSVTGTIVHPDHDVSQCLYTRSIRLVGIHVSLLPSVSKLMPNAALALEEAQLVPAGTPLGDKDVRGRAWRRPTGWPGRSGGRPGSGWLNWVWQQPLDSLTTVPHHRSETSSWCWAAASGRATVVRRWRSHTGRQPQRREFRVRGNADPNADHGLVQQNARLASVHHCSTRGTAANRALGVSPAWGARRLEPCQRARD
jgi:hypothetical protein